MKTTIKTNISVYDKQKSKKAKSKVSKLVPKRVIKLVNERNMGLWDVIYTKYNSEYRDIILICTILMI